MKPDAGNTERGTGSQWTLALLAAALAGDVSAAPAAVGGREAFSAPLPGLSRAHRREFHTGNSFFKDNWVAAPATAVNRDGLGPLFHARSCSSCHVNDGRGSPPLGDVVMTGLLLRLSAADGTPDAIYGNQLAVRALPGAMPEATVKVTWVESEVKFADGEVVSLRRPEWTVTQWNYGEPAAGLLMGARLAPAVFGGGLLEAADNPGSRADPDDKDGDGISGRVNLVPDASGTKVPGRFGWKANVASLRQQAADAFAGDMGITSAEHPGEHHTSAQAAKLASFPDGGRPEADALVMARMESYLRGLGAPAPRLTGDTTVQAGRELFSALKCSACHLPEMKTGDAHPFKELRGQTFHPFTDLLLHDMGSELADGRPDGDASGSEWRTAPLWGLGLHETVNGNAFFLHDGRARSVQEAILWHGGEAAASREAFKALPRPQRAALLAFLQSL